MAVESHLSCASKRGIRLEFANNLAIGEGQPI